MLWNSTGADADVGEAIIEAVLGKAADDAKPLEGDINDFAGTYKGVGRGRPTEAVLAVDGSVLTLKAGPGKPDTLRYIGNDTFRNGSTLLSFERANGKPSRLRMDAGYGYYISEEVVSLATSRESRVARGRRAGAGAFALLLLCGPASEVASQAATCEQAAVTSLRRLDSGPPRQRGEGAAGHRRRRGACRGAEAVPLLERGRRRIGPRHGCQAHA